MAISSVNVGPLVLLARMEMAIVEGWTKAMFSMLKPMAGLCAFPAMLGVCPEHRRWHDEPPQGADLIGKYGHRPHDVDAERAV